MTGAVLVLGLGAVALGGAMCASRRAFAPGLAVQAAGAALVAVGGFWALAAGDVLGAPFTSSFAPRLGVDGLSAFFLGTLGLIAAPALVYSIRYLQPDARDGRSRCSPPASCSRSRSWSAPATRSRSCSAGS